MRVYLIPAQAPCLPHDIDVKSIPDTDYDTGHYAGLMALQEMVGGWIEPCAPVQLREQGIELLCNDEGLLTGLPYNINMFPFFFVGNLVAVGVKGDKFVSLTPEQEQWLKQWIENLS